MTYHQSTKSKEKSKSVIHAKLNSLWPSLVDGVTTAEVSEKVSENFTKAGKNWLGSNDELTKPSQQRQTSAKGIYASDRAGFSTSVGNKRQDHHKRFKESIISDIPSNDLNEDISVGTDNTSLHSEQTPIITNKSKKVWKKTKSSTSWNEFIVDGGGCTFFSYDKKCLADEDDDFYQAKSSFSTDFDDLVNFNEEASDLFKVDGIPKTEVDILETSDSDENEKFETNSDIFDGIETDDNVFSATPDMFCDDFFSQRERSVQTYEKPNKKIEKVNTSGSQPGTVVQTEPSRDCKNSQIVSSSDIFDGLESHDEFVSFTSNTFREEKSPLTCSTSQSSLGSKEFITFQNKNTQPNLTSRPNESTLFSEKEMDLKSFEKSKNDTTEDIESVCSDEKCSASEDKNARKSDIDHSLLIRIGWVQSIVRIIQSQTEKLNQNSHHDAKTSFYSQTPNEKNMLENDGDESPRSVARLIDSQSAETKRVDQYFFGTVQTVLCNDEYICKNTMINLSSKIRDTRAQKLRLFYSHQNGKEVRDTENIACTYNFANSRLQEKYLSSLSDTEFDLETVSQFLKLSMDAHERAMLHIEVSELK